MFLARQFAMSARFEFSNGESIKFKEPDNFVKLEETSLTDFNIAS